MKRALTLLGVLGLAAALAGPVFANGLNLNSLGSRALAMGGAYVGLANDFSAIFWNPAGIASIKQRTFGFFGTDIIPKGSYRFDALNPDLGEVTMVDAKTKTKHYLAGLAAYYVPLSKTVTAGLGVYVPSGLGAAWKGDDFKKISLGTAYEWSSKVGLVTIAPALAWQVNDRIAVGATLDINYGSFDLKTHAGSVPGADGPRDLGQYEENLKGWGYGATLGILVKPHRLFSLGATVRTASKVSLEGEARISNLAYLGLKDVSDIKRDVAWPLWLAGGVAFYPSQVLTLTADVQYTRWSKMDVMKTQYLDPFWAVLMAADAERPMHWKDATQIRFGAEYRIRPDLALRAGYYWDPTPVPDQTMNVLLPSYDFNVATFGLGYVLDGLAIDLGFELLMGAKRTVGFLNWYFDPEYKSAMPGTYEMTLLVPNLSIRYEF